MEFNFGFESFKKNFFGTAATDILSKEEKRALGRMGAYTRTIARNSLKYKDGPAAAGQPPHVHRLITRVRLKKKTGEVKEQQVSPLKELLFFAYDRSSKSTVVGPVLFNSSRKSQPVGDTVPGLLERGGRMTMVSTKRVKVTGRKVSERQKAAFVRKLKDGTLTRPVREVVVRTAKAVQPHPFMKPAMVKALPKFPDLFISRG